MELTDKELIEMYRYMLLARRFDEIMVELYHSGKGVIEGPHSHIGQEAIGVGACYKLRKSDYIVPSLRTRPALLVRGVSPKELMAGMFGKASGPARAKVTTHHIGDNERGIVGTTGIVGSHLPIADGVALAVKLKKQDSVVLCFLGDGATNRGDFHEALNFAAVKSLPVIFIIENNQYAMWTPISSSVAIKNLADRAMAYGFPGVVVDGNDVTAVHNKVQEAISRARLGDGPTLVECKTYRLRAHAEGVQEQRPKKEIEEWSKKDPVKRFERQLLERGVLTEELARKIEKEVNTEIKEAVEFAQTSPFPDVEEMMKDVYSNNFLPKEYGEGEYKTLRKIPMSRALNEALREEMTRDEDIILLGEDLGPDAIGIPGGPTPPTRNLCSTFPERIIGTPISESLIVGAAVGAALAGLRPVAEIMYCDFLPLAMDHIINTAAKMRYTYGGKASVPMVIRTRFGTTGRSLGMHHSQCAEAWLLNVPGIKMVMPSTPFDAKGLLKSSIRDDDPVIFFEHTLLYGLEGYVPEEEYLIPIGKADIKREGDDVTIIATGLMVHRALSAADRLQKENISVEIVDLRTLLPMDKEAIIKSVKKTNKLVIVHEAPKTGGIAGEVSAIVAEEALEYLDAPIQRVTAPDTPVPFSPPLEKAYLPDEEKLVSAVLKIARPRA